jgi:long-chain acyl-CoA synthetase
MEEPVAVVVLKDGANVTEPELRAFVAERLAAFKVPVKIVFARTRSRATRPAS